MAVGASPRVLEIVRAACLFLLASAGAEVPSVDDDLPDLQTSLVQMSIDKLHGRLDPRKVLGSGVLNMDATPVLEAMAAAPSDAATQFAGCTAMGMLNSAKREVTRELVKPIVDAITNNVADKQVVKACFFALLALRPTFDRPVTVALNNGTHLAEALALVQRSYADDRDMMKDALMYEAAFASYVACDVQRDYVQAGCMDQTWSALDRFRGPESSDVQFAAWQGFSDYSGCPLGGEAIISHGGRNAGVPRMVQALHDAVGNYFHPDTLHGGDIINLQYEIMTVALGVLKNANATNGRFDAFVEAGFADAVMRIMRDSPGERSTNHRCCTALRELSKNATVATALQEAGAIELIVAAMEKFKGQDDRWFVVNNAGDNYPVLPECDGALRNFAADSIQTQDKLLQLGVLDVYTSMRDDLLPKYPEMRELPGLLRARQEHH